MNVRARLAAGLALALLVAACADPASFAALTDISPAAAACSDPSFDATREIVEAGAEAESRDACWWLSSGARVEVAHGVARSIHGELPATDEWRVRYAASSAVDTDGGVHPQNLLRLVTRASWRDYRQDVRFRIERLNLSSSPQRDEWSGVFLFQRYQDSQSLYYVGVRVDGTAVIKKKLYGKYTTLAQRPVFGDPRTYNRLTNPCLLPVGRWIGLSSQVSTAPDGTVHVQLSTRDEQAGGEWRLAVEAIDDGRDGAPIVERGRGGLRSDFMDIDFTGYIARGSP